MYLLHNFTYNSHEAHSSLIVLKGNDEYLFIGMCGDTAQDMAIKFFFVPWTDTTLDLWRSILLATSIFALLSLQCWLLRYARLSHAVLKLSRSSTE